MRHGGRPTGTQKVESYRDLRVWQLGMDLVAEAYRLSRSLPASERYGLRSQIQRAAISVPANIAEGNARNQLGAYLNHLRLAKGSLAELETLFALGTRLSFFDERAVQQHLKAADDLSRMLATLIRRLEAPNRSKLE